MQQTVTAADPEETASESAQAPVDDLEPQLKYERLGADVKSILRDASATCLCLSEKVLALGTSTGSIHILDYSGNEVKRFNLHSKAVRNISFDDKAEYVASCCGENYVSISGLYTDEANKYTFKRPITVVALEPRYTSRKTREFVTGDVRGRLQLSSQGWLGRSDYLIHQGEGAIRAVTWHSSTLVWANDVGLKVYDTNSHQFIGSIARPKGGRFADCYDCRLYLHEGTYLYVAWPDCIKVAQIVSSTDPVSGAASKKLTTTYHVPTDTFCMAAVPHGADLAVLVYVTDADPDQDQVGLSDDINLGQQQQQLLLPGDEDQDVVVQPSEAAAAAASGDNVAGTTDGLPEPDAAATAATPPAAAAASVPGPVNIPQPIKRQPRAANAIVRSPSGPSVLEEAAAAAVASATVARSSSGNSDSDQAAAAARDSQADSNAGASAAAAASKSPSRKVSPTAGKHGAAAAGGDAAAAARPSSSSSRGWSRASSVISRGSDSAAGGGAAAADSLPQPYLPPGKPLRPELRILALDSSSKRQQQQQQGKPPGSCFTEKASDALTVKGYSDYLPSDYMLVPSYGNDFALMSGGSSRKQQQQQQGSQQQQSRAATAGKIKSAGQGTAAAKEAAAASGTQISTARIAGDLGRDTAGAAAAAAAGSSDLVVEDFGEFMYFIVSPKDIVVGRHRDTEDRISWFLAAGHFEAALAIAQADRSLNTAVWDTVVQAYLEYLTAAGQWSAAAAKLQQLLKNQAGLWERWVYTFAQARQLPLLAPVLPTKQPLLHAQCYDMVLQALLVDPAHHGQLLDLVQRWPHSCFHPTALIDAIATRMQRPGGDSRELWQALAVLYKSQGRPDLSLAIYLQLQLPTVFDFIQDHSLLSYLDEKAYLLMAIDEGRALKLLAGHLDTLPPGAVVPGLLDAMSVCESEADAEGQQIWRKRLFHYLDNVFKVDPSAGGDYAELCVHLYADYCPARLMEFLQGSQTYPLEAALEVATQRGMVDEQVYILSRMGNTRAALALIIERLQDIPRAIDFVRAQRDDELVEELIDWALRSADTTGQLLDHIGGNMNPLRVIQKIPEGMAIARLRDRLRSIIADFRTQTSLREGCNAILRSDCIHLVQRLQMEVKRALPVVWVQRIGSHGAGMPPSVAAAAAAAAAVTLDEALAHHGAGHSRRGSAGGLGYKDTGPVTQPSTPKQQGVTKAFVEGAGFSTPLDVTPPSTPGNASPIRVSVQKALRGSSYLPAAAPAGKGAQWLKYCSSSGQVMEVVSAQELPAAAVAGISGNGDGARSPTRWGGPTSSLDALPSQPVRTWISQPCLTGDNSTLLQLMTGEAGIDQSSSGQTSLGLSGGSSRRGPRHGHHRQRSSAHEVLTSLVAA